LYANEENIDGYNDRRDSWLSMTDDTGSPSEEEEGVANNGISQWLAYLMALSGCHGGVRNKYQRNQQSEQYGNLK
jgi:hypothetical protein